MRPLLLEERERLWQKPFWVAFLVAPEDLVQIVVVHWQGEPRGLVVKQVLAVPEHQLIEVVVNEK